jgi:hypothetical protein
MQTLAGSFYVMVLYDVAEEIDLVKLSAMIQGSPPRREPTFKHPAPDYVKFERTPVVETMTSVSLASGEVFQCLLKYFDYGILCVELTLDFETEWDQLVRLSSRWINAPDLEKAAADLVTKRVKEIEAVLEDKYEAFLSEDYYVIHVNRAADESGGPMRAEEMEALHSEHIVQIIRGESTPLSKAECAEVLQTRLSYYPTDLLVTGWVASLVYDTDEGAAPTIQLLEYANAQLLEFRHYDDLLTRVLEGVYDQLELKGGVFRRWRMAHQAERLNSMRLEVTEIAERADNAIKFLSDMFYARAYRVAAARVGVNDYRHLVDEKLKIAADLYQSMVNEFHQARAFVLEVMVVAILVIELIHLFRGGI